MASVKTIARRSFLIGSSAIAGGVAFGVYSYKKPLPNPLETGLQAGEAALTPFVKIDKNGVTLITPRADKGQGAYSIQAYLLAEELDVDPTQVRLSPGVPSPTYYNSTVMNEGMPGMGHVIGRLMGLQITGGSSTVPDMYERLRRAGAVARETLKRTAAKEFNVSIADLTTEDSHVILPDARRIPYTALASKAAKVKPAEASVLRDPKTWRYLGKDILRTDIVAKSTGRQVYGIDLEFDNMFYATVRANPGIGGGVKSYDAQAARDMRGVLDILPVKNGIAVVADNTWRAFKAAEAINIEWGVPPYPINSDAIWSEMYAHIAPEFQNIQRLNAGDVSTIDGVNKADSLAVEYRTPFLAHAPMEPMNAVVMIQDKRCDIWTGTQIPRFVQSHVAKQTGLKNKDVHIHVQAMGGSFGRRLELTYVLQAVEIAQSMPNVPVKLIWSREEDMTHDYPRPATIAKGRGAVKDGKITHFDLGIVGASLTHSGMSRLASPLPGPDPTLTTGADDQPYAIENYRVTGYRAPENVPISSWRSVGASQNGFYHECLFDELVALAGADPLEERLRLCTDAVTRKILEKAGEVTNWSSRTLGPNRGRGLALTQSFGVSVAQIIDITQTMQGIKIDKVHIITDVGRILDPVNLEAQLTGGAIWGLGHAINCELTYENYAAQQTNYHEHAGMRLYQTPEIEVTVLENSPHILGAGEPAVPPAAPALANAIFAATGQRLREMPFQKYIDFV